jgi:hypothetical protein
MELGALLPADLHEGQFHATGLINSSNLSIFDQTATDLLGRV